MNGMMVTDCPFRKGRMTISATVQISFKGENKK